MILDLNPLPYRLALDIITWCFDNDIDRAKAFQLTEAMTIPAHEREFQEVEWTLDIPDHYVSWLILKYT